jgi:hypothetical protein
MSKFVSVYSHNAYDQVHDAVVDHRRRPWPARRTVCGAARFGEV